MKKLLTLVIAVFAFYNTDAQTQEDFDAAGNKILHMVTDSVITVQVPFIRKKEYFDVIDRQTFSNHQKAVLKQKLNTSFDGDLKVMMNKLEGLRESYEIERQQGASFEYYETLYEPMDNSIDTYAVRTTYIYRSGKVQNLVSFEYELAWLGNRFALISEIKENF